MFFQTIRITGILFLTLLTVASPIHAQQYIELNSRKTVSQPILLYELAEAKASIVLFAGGDGFVNLSQDGSILRLTNNFLLRSIKLFLNQGLRVIVFDVPSHRVNDNGLLGGYRTSKQHALDIERVVDYLRERYSEPVWLIGTSRGSTSVATAGVYLGDKVDGLVITAPLTQANNKGSHLYEIKLKIISVPVYLASHSSDECWVTPPRNIMRVKKKLVNSARVQAVIYDDSAKKEGDSRYQYTYPGRACGGLSAHGFFGIENDVIRDISAFISFKN
ncbi:MAG: alpha/beta hydrolase [Cellvibrionaceae bacterium]